MSPRQLADGQDMLARLPGTLVFDHLGQVPQPAGLSSPSFTILRRLLDGGRAYVKLSGAYITSKEGPPGYADAGLVAAGFIQAAPERVVWGSDWPHPTAPVSAKPDDAVLFDRLAGWAGDAAGLKRILVDNPARLYGFPA
jgi:D-galactarolactone isomerase